MEVVFDGYVLLSMHRRVFSNDSEYGELGFYYGSESEFF